ncbi:DUF6077 domain-containing protein [Actinomadura rifamycini]|uniref:DUF6077 domain-containing protein n=1 Tax=Actinomadura rifamycini TaxID=31962 RepID=UPI00042A4571|nr:DUF6077 domain-containing protein [Actinomadura rifamycini]
MTEVRDRVAGPGTGDGRGAAGGRRPGAWTRVTRAVDGLVDAAVLAFAAWTVVYHVCLALQPPTWAMLACWATVSAAGTAVWFRLPAGRPLWDDRVAAAAVHRVLAGVAVAAAVAAGTSAGLHGEGVPWWCTWAAGAVSVAATAAALLRRPAERAGGADGDGGGRPRGDGARGEAGDRGDEEAARWGTPLALLTGAGLAVASLFVLNSDGDDAYFVSRSVATAETGRIPMNDVIFTRGATDPIAGEPPVSSIEVFAGALARILGVPGASFVWYVLLPAVTFLAVWALWRLVRAWAPRRAALCLAVGVVYLLWTGLSPASLGSFHLLRMWQGKAVLVSLLVPLLFAYLTHWAERRTRRDLVLLGAAGVAAVGLTSTAAFVVSLVVLAAAAPLVVAGRVRTGLAACAAMAYPVAAGLAVILLYDSVSVHGTVHDAPASYRAVLLYAALGVLAGCALWLGPWTVRPGVPALICGGAAALLTLLILPGVLALAADVTGAGQVLWRTMWLVPAPALIGLLAAVRLPGAVRPRISGRGARAAAAGAPAAVLAAAIVVGGTPVWAESNGSVLADRPSWKAYPAHLGTAREVVEAAGPGGIVLMPGRYMRLVPLLTTETHAVNPNSHYLSMLPAPERAIHDRELLSAAVRSARSEKPAPAEVAEALRRLDVRVACAYRRDGRGLHLLQAAGYGGARRIGSLACVFPGGGR